MKIHSPTGCCPPEKQRCFTCKRQPKSVIQIRDSYEPKIIWPIQIWTKSPRIWVVSRVVNNLARHEASKRFFCNTSNGLISHEWGLQRTKMALMKFDETTEYLQNHVQGRGMLAWRSCKRMFKSQRKCNINCNVGMNMLTLCEFLVFYLPFVVAFYGWTVVSCQLGFCWGSPGAVKGSCNMCNLQSQKLRAVHPCFASYVHDAVHLSEKQLHMLLQPTCLDLKH